MSALQFDFQVPDEQRGYHSFLRKEDSKRNSAVKHSKSMSLISLLKTVQSLFYLGKIALPSRNMVFNPNTQLNESSGVEFDYSWTKAFKMVLEHQFLSLYAFEED